MNILEPVGIVVFGLGRSGSIHASNVLANPRTKLRWIVEEDVQKAEKFLGDRRVTDVRVVPVADAGLALEDQEARAAFVCTPTATHPKVIVDCLRAGKAVFCEKPVAEDVESIGKVTCLCHSVNRRTVGTQKEFRNRLIMFVKQSETTF